MQESMSRPEIASDHERFQIVAKEAAALSSAVTLWEEYVAAQNGLKAAKAFLKEYETDEEMSEMAREEIADFDAQLIDIEKRLMVRSYT